MEGGARPPPPRGYTPGRGEKGKEGKTREDGGLWGVGGGGKGGRGGVLLLLILTKNNSSSSSPSSCSCCSSSPLLLQVDSSRMRHTELGPGPISTPSSCHGKKGTMGGGAKVRDWDHVQLFGCLHDANYGPHHKVFIE